ncbi:MAG: MHYT domain-containing protein [Rhodospirillaceae bacterium]
MDFAQLFAGAGEAALALPPSYEPSLVLLSYLISSLAGYAFLRLAARIAELVDSPARFVWLAGGALTMGLGVWAMHFVGMLAYRLPIPVSYDALVTAVSAIPAVLASAVALYIVARPTITMTRLLLGGTFMGAGIGVMHYTGMASMRVDAFVRYDPILFATSIVVAVALAILALQVTFWTKRRTAAQPTLVHDLLGASIMGLAVSGMHYTAMTSTLCIPGGECRPRRARPRPSGVRHRYSRGCQHRSSAGDHRRDLRPAAQPGNRQTPAGFGPGTAPRSADDRRDRDHARRPRHFRQGRQVRPLQFAFPGDVHG